MYTIELLNPFPEYLKNNLSATSIIDPNPDISKINTYIWYLRTNKIDFPYKRFYISEQKCLTLFDLLKRFKNNWSTNEYTIEQKGRVKFPVTYISPIFNQNIIGFYRDIHILDTISNKYDIINEITDYFLEYSRI